MLHDLDFALEAVVALLSLLIIPFLLVVDHDAPWLIAILLSDDLEDVLWVAKSGVGPLLSM